MKKNIHLSHKPDGGGRQLRFSDLYRLINSEYNLGYDRAHVLVQQKKTPKIDQGPKVRPVNTKNHFSA